MKKLAIILIILVYGLSSTGAIVHLDYCCGKLSNISLVPSQDDKKDCHGKSIHGKSCCDSKQVLLKVKGEQVSAAKWVNIQKQAASAISAQHQSYAVIHCDMPLNEYSTGPPHISSSIPLFLQHCLFRI